MFSLKHLKYPRVGWVGKREGKTTAEEASKGQANITDGKFQIAVRQTMLT